jgi:hypothetical protein
LSISIRVDDFLFTKRHELESGRHSLENFREFHDVIPVRYMLGIIPGTLCELPGGKFPEDLLPKIVPAMHGITHDESKLNELAEYSHNAQRCQQRLGTGLQLMASAGVMGVQIYMPPHNVVDWGTVVSCRSLGMHVITGGPETDQGVASAMANIGVRYMPSMPPALYGRSDELVQRGMVPEIRRLAEEGDHVLGLHWTWETNIGLDHLRRFIDEVSDVLVDFRL